MEEYLEIIKQDLYNEEEILDVLNNPITKILTNIPGVDSMRNIAEKMYRNSVNSRQNELIELIIQDSFITSDMVYDVEFLTNLSKSHVAVAKLSNNDKIKYFANLLRNGYLKGERIKADDFDEMFNIISQLSYRQIQVVSILYEVETNSEKYIDTAVSEKEHLVDRYWGNFEKRMKDELNIESEEVYPIMHSIQSTGLFAFYNGLSFGEVTNGTLTPYFKGFLKWVLVCG